MKTITGKDHREVALPSQEGTKGVMQYALYVVAYTCSGDMGVLGWHRLTQEQYDP